MKGIGYNSSPFIEIGVSLYEVDECGAKLDKALLGYVFPEPIFIYISTNSSSISVWFLTISSVMFANLNGSVMCFFVSCFRPARDSSI